MWYKVVSIIKLTSHMVVYAAIWLCLCSRISQNPIIYHHFHSFSLFRSGWWFQPLWKILINEKDYHIYSWVLYPPRPNRHTQWVLPPFSEPREARESLVPAWPGRKALRAEPRRHKRRRKGMERANPGGEIWSNCRRHSCFFPMIELGGSSMFES